MKKVIIITSAILLLVLYVLKGYFFGLIVDYEQIAVMPEVKPGKELSAYLTTVNKTHEHIGHLQLLDKALKVSDELKFVFKKANNDPNKMLTDKEANCVGYAACLATAYRYMLKENNDNIYQVRHLRGKVSIFGIKSPSFLPAFFQNHDYVEVENPQTGELFIVDPVVHDYFGIRDKYLTLVGSP